MGKSILPTDFSDAQWSLLEPMLPKPARTGRPRTPLRRVVNALLYIAKAGCHWSLLLRELPALQDGLPHLHRMVQERSHGWDS